MSGWWIALLILLCTRVAISGAYPLLDPTEARYAEIARKMLESGNWVTPQFDDGMPFWGKPPLFFWATSTTMAVFGVGEIGARLAPFAFTLLTIGVLLMWRPRESRDHSGTIGAVVFLSSALGFVAAGAVMTDMALTFATALCMVSFWRAAEGCRGAAVWAWLLFVGLALGLLAKGPAAAALATIGIALWLVWQKTWRSTWHALPWLRGTLLVALVALPWYAWAEYRTPGFLHYFLIGEHWQRFTESGWKGDLYGAGHARAPGTIWLYMLVGALPWTLFLPAVMLCATRGPKTATRPSDPATRYLVCWTLSPLVLFTFARNILPAYVLPALPAFALLTARAILAGWEARRRFACVWGAALLVPLTALGIIVFGKEQLELHSQRKLLEHWDRRQPLIYLFERPHSAAFYSRGQALKARDHGDIERWLAAESPALLIVPEERMPQLPNGHLTHWIVLAKHGRYVMLRRRPIKETGVAMPGVVDSAALAGGVVTDEVARHGCERRQSRT